MNKRIVILLVGILLFLVGVGVWLFSYNKIENGVKHVQVVPCSGQTFTPCSYVSTPFLLPDTSEYAGIISSSTIKGYDTYTNKRYGFQFSYPKEYVVGDNRLGYPINGEEELGQFWLNNPASDYGNNGSITINILNSKEYLVGSYDKMMMKKQISAAGQPVYVYDVEQHYPESGGYKFLLYIITLPSHPGKYLGIKFHGYLANLLTQNQIDEMIQTIKWLPVEKK